MTTPRTQACQQTLRDISAYLDGELAPDACDAIERHALHCPGCAALIDGLRETAGLCRKAAGATMPEAVRERARAAIRQLLDRDPR